MAVRYTRQLVVILCAVDDSPQSRWAVECLQGLCSMRNSRLLLLNVAEYGVPFPKKGIEALKLPEDQSEALFESLKREVVSSAWGSVQYAVLCGHPVADIVLRASIENKVDLIAIGGHGMPDVTYFLTGSVSRRVVLRAFCSVLIVKQWVPVPARIVVGIDGSAGAREAVEFPLRLSLPRQVRIAVVGVVPSLPFPAAEMTTEGSARKVSVGEFLAADAARTTEEAAERLRGEGYDAKSIVRHGHPAHELMRFAEVDRADYLVVGFRGLTGDHDRPMASVAESIVLYAGCSVLVCRPAMSGPDATRS